MYVFDLESNGLLREATVVHCIVMQDTEKKELEIFYDGPKISGFCKLGNVIDGVNRLREVSKLGHVLAGHNICGFDFPLLTKLYPKDWRTPKDVLDTFMASCLLFPEQHEHGLEYYGRVLKQEKPTQDQWVTLDSGMLTRCTGDVRLNTTLLRRVITPRLAKDAEHNIHWGPAFDLEFTVQRIHARQEMHGVKYDIPKAIALWERLEEKIVAFREEIYKTLPYNVVETHKGTPVAKPYTISGQFSAMTLKHYGTAEEARKANIKGPFSRVKYEQMNLDSDAQVKDYLLTLGWKPTEWNKSKLTKERTSPKLTEDSFGSLPAGIGKAIADYNILTHRQGMISSRTGDEVGALWKVRDDGRVPAKAFTCGTPTSRYRHKEVVCNIPRVGTQYGEELRSLFIVPDDCYMLGLDLKGIEIRVAAHYCFNYPGGKELAAEILSGDFHDANAAMWDTTRNQSKTGLYALMYGCMAPKLAEALKKPAHQAKALFDDFWINRAPLKMLVEDLKLTYKANKFIKGIDGRKIQIRDERKLLNSLIQSTSAVIFKWWMVANYSSIHFMNAEKNLHQVIAYHDELQYEAQMSQGSVEMFAKIFATNATKVGQELKFLVPVEADYKIGKNWCETH
jgi:DNA polymerase I-like protein with 3'-5' exonuclease and polymerase domains